MPIEAYNFDNLPMRHTFKIEHSRAELEDDIRLQKCKSCIHYDFYFCKKLHKSTGPDASQPDCEEYEDKPNYSK